MIHEQYLVLDRTEADVVPDILEADLRVSPLFLTALGALASQQIRGVEPNRDHNGPLPAFDSATSVHNPL
jgi:hypothetical protein